MKIEKTIEEKLKESYLKGESKGFTQAFALMLFVLLIPCGYIFIQNSHIEFDKQVNKYLYEKLASDCQVKIDSMDTLSKYMSKFDDFFTQIIAT